MKWQWGRIVPSQIYKHQRSVALCCALYKLRPREFRPVRQGDLFISQTEVIPGICAVKKADGPFTGTSPRFIVDVVPVPKCDWWQ